jgi:hypothetical protein
MPQSLGGVATTSRLTLFPMVDAVSGRVGFYAFDPSNGFDDPYAGSFYSFKVEDVVPGRVPTIRKIIASYTDLGVATATFSLSGTLFMAPSTQQIVTASTSVQIGTSAFTGRIMTTLIDLSITGMNLQLTITRAARGGPLSFTKIILCGNVERQLF